MPFKRFLERVVMPAALTVPILELVHWQLATIAWAHTWRRGHYLEYLPRVGFTSVVVGLPSTYRT